MNQPTVPANPGDILYSTRVMMFITLLCMGYELSRSIPVSKAKSVLLLPATINPSDPEWESLPIWQKKASEKAIERYTATQEKKWRKWNEAMFERSS
ncbi:MAG: hypothetical protein PHQ43_11835 [Dehalococcoidales bacterium]|nr:hypothetical protein [Dehalococcoidales bacterium]